MKKNEIVTLGNNVDELVVQKSNPLFSLYRSNLTLNDFKILDTYLARINMYDDSRKTVVFEKGEFEKLLGVTQLKEQELDISLKRLMTTVKIDDSKENKGFMRLSLFEQATAKQDEYGLWQIRLSCTELSKKYIFDIENIGYIRYKLRNVVKLKSRYSYIMFHLLEKNRKRGKFSIDVKSLKAILNCSEEETYQQFKHFNDKILKKAHKEINEKTQCHYEYKLIKQGRIVKAVEFDIESLKESVEKEIELNEVIVDKKIGWNDLIKEFEMLPEDKSELEAVLLSYSTNDEELYDYLNIMIATYNRVASTTPINSPKKYLIAMIKKDIESKRKNQVVDVKPATTKTNKFNNFENKHKYDYAALERQLLNSANDTNTLTEIPGQ